MSPPEDEYLAVVDEEQAGVRLDAYLAEMSGLSRSRLQRVIRERGAEIDGRREKRCARKVQAGSRISITIPQPDPSKLRPLEVDLEILFEDSDLLVVNKPSGMVVHPAPGHSDDTLVNALVHRTADLSGIGGVLRPGIVHRLDRDTSGVLVIAKHDESHLGLARQFASHRVERRYVALAVPLKGGGWVEGRGGSFDTEYGRHPKERKRFSSRFPAGRRAVTHFEVLEKFSVGVLKIECWLETGRTHQIRVHFADAGCPLLGDPLYGGRAMRASRLMNRQALHAAVLGFEHPRTGRSMRFEGAFPEDFKDAERRLRDGAGWC